MLFKSPSLLAVLVNESRAKDTGRSLDIYARSWIPPSRQNDVSLLWNDYSNNVYKYDDTVLSVRNRYFINLFNKYCENDTVCILMPCGLVSYPMLINKSVKFIEVDLPDLIDYKNKIIKSNEERENFPKCIRELVSLDICDNNSRNEFLTTLEKHNKKIFLLEGFSYYLDDNKWWSIIKDILSVSKEGDVIAFDFWSIEEKDKKIYGKFKQFCNRYLTHKLDEFLFLEENDIRTKLQNKIVEIISVVDAEYRMLNSFTLKKQRVLKDTYVVLSV